MYGLLESQQLRLLRLQQAPQLLEMHRDLNSQYQECLSLQLQHDQPPYSRLKRLQQSLALQQHALQLFSQQQQQAKQFIDAKPDCESSAGLRDANSKSDEPSAPGGSNSAVPSFLGFIHNMPGSSVMSDNKNADHGASFSSLASSRKK